MDGSKCRFMKVLERFEQWEYWLAQRLPHDMTNFLPYPSYTQHLSVLPRVQMVLNSIMNWVADHYGPSKSHCYGSSACLVFPCNTWHPLFARNPPRKFLSCSLALHCIDSDWL